MFTIIAVTGPTASGKTALAIEKALSTDAEIVSFDSRQFYSMMDIGTAKPSEQELDYMSLENHVTKDTPPCFLWQTVTDQTVPVENSYLFAQACAQAGVPFAQHVFSEGIHGLSVATEEWLEQNIGQEEGKRYTQEQVQMLAEAIEAGETPFPQEKGEELLVKFGIGRKKPARWTEKQKEGIRKTLKEVQSWTQLAEVWMEKYLKVE